MPFRWNDELPQSQEDPSADDRVRYSIGLQSMRGCQCFFRVAEHASQPPIRPHGLFELRRAEYIDRKSMEGGGVELHGNMALGSCVMLQAYRMAKER